MFEHSTLQEAYTGSLIAGKGKSLNNINVIMDRIRINYEDWARVRFGAGTPWRRCWCVISPPDEKEVAKQQKLNKKKSAYDRSLFTLKGEVKFYDTKRTKKVQPIATIKDVYSAYAIYPQSKPLIDQSTLVKVEGTIIIHSNPETTTEGFVFVMPEVHPAVSGFEMMLRWLFPAYDVFALYGRPNRLIADTLDTRSLMFALPQERRYGYLEILDVATLIHTEGSNNWSDREWRSRLKQLTSERMMRLKANGSRTGSLAGSRRGHRNSLPSRAGLRFEEESMRSSPSLAGEFAPTPPPHTSTTPTTTNGAFAKKISGHNRSVSEATGYGSPQRQRGNTEGAAAPAYSPSRLSYEANHSTSALTEYPPAPPPHDPPMPAVLRNPQIQRHAGDGLRERSSSESERRSSQIETQNVQRDMQPNLPPAPVTSPPAFSHQPGAKPSTRPYHHPELRRAKSRMSSTTLSELAAASNAGAAGGIAAAGAAAAWKGNNSGGEWHSEEQRQRGVNDDASKSGVSANGVPVYEGMELAQPSFSEANEKQPHPSRPPPHQAPESGSPILNVSNSNLGAPVSGTPRSVSPLSQISTHSPSPSPSPLRPTISSESNGPASSAYVPADPNYSTSPLTRSVDRPPDNPPPAAETSTPSAKRPSTSRSILRKPVGGAQSRLSPAPVPAHQPSSESLRRYANNSDNVNGIHKRNGSNTSITSIADSHLEAVHKTYDDLRNPSPDYTTGTEPTSPTTEHDPNTPRRGILKTVGPGPQDIIIGDVHYRKEIPAATSSTKPGMPSTNVGRNSALASKKPQPLSHERTKSADRLLSQPGAQGRMSPGGPEQPRNRTPEFNGGRSMAWSPGLTSNNNSTASKGPTITAEQFVQQRAAASRVTPVYAHARKQSGTPPNASHTPSGDVNGHHRKQSSTPPTMSRHSSGDWSQLPRRSPTPNGLQPRPSSRSSTHMMSSIVDYSSHLSAREQEHVARVTGSPLINLNANSKPTSGGQGLIGALEAREKEKKDIKDGLGGQLVQHAIAQRQQLAQERLYQQGQQQQQQQQVRGNVVPSQQAFPFPSPQLHLPGQYPQTPQTPYGNWPSPGAPQQQYYAPGQQQALYNQPLMTPSHQAYWSAGFSRPLSPPQQQMQQFQAQQFQAQQLQAQQFQAQQYQAQQYQAQQYQQAQQQGQLYQQQGYFGQGQGGR